MQSTKAAEGPVLMPRTAWIALGVFMLFYMMNALDRLLPSLMVKNIKADLSIDDLQMSLIMGVAFALFYAIWGLPFGWILDQAPRRIVLYFAVTLWSCAMIACGLANNFTQLFFARMILGAGEAALAPAAHSMLADIFPKRKLATALSVFTTGAALGTGLSISLGGLAVAHLTQYQWVELPLLGNVRGWQLLFIICGAPGLFLAFLVFAFPEPPRPIKAEKGKPRESLLPFLRQPVFIFLAGSFGVFSMVPYGVNLWVAAFMDRTFGMGPGVAGPLLGAIDIFAVIAGTIGAGSIVDRLVSRGQYDGYLRVFLISIIVGAPIGAIGFLSSDLPTFLLCLTILKFATFTFIGYGAATFQAISPNAMRGRMSAVYLLMLATIGNGGGPFLIGWLTDKALGNPNQLGTAIAIMIASVTPIAAVSAWLGLKPLHAAVARQNEPATQSAGAA